MFLKRDKTSRDTMYNNMDLKGKKMKSEKCHKWAFGDGGSYFFPRTDQRMKKHNLSMHISFQDPT